MSLLPYIFNEFFSSPIPRRLVRSNPVYYMRPWIHSPWEEAEYYRPTQIGKDGFKVTLDVQDFKPDEINVKTVDNAVIIEGKHEERKDNEGFISRHFTRRYELPKGIDFQKIESTLSTDGVLTLQAPKIAEAEENSRQIEIKPTGPARESINCSDEIKKE